MTAVIMVIAAAHVGATVVEAAAVRAGTAVLGSTPEPSVVAEKIVAAVVVAIRKRTEASGIVVAGRLAYGTGIGAAVPACSARQSLGDIGIVTSAHILVLAAYIIGKLCPLRIAWHVPPCGTDALHATGVGTAGGGIPHHRRPVVQQTVGGHIGGTVVRIIPIGRGSGCITALCNGGIVGILRGAQILLHPALLSNLHRVVGVAVNVGEGGDAWTGITVLRKCGKTHLIPIRRSHAIGCIRPYIIGGAICQPRYAAGEAAGSSAVSGMNIPSGRIW